MPLYHFRCDCGHETELRCKMGEVVTCPCGQEMQRVPAGCSFQLKGGGWYADGYKGGMQ